MRKLIPFLLCLPALCTVASASQSFPSGLIPFTSIYSISAPDAAGDRLVIGIATVNSFAEIISGVLPASTGAIYSDASIELAPGKFFSNVFIPTPAELQGDFSAVDIPVLNPSTGQAFAGNIIPQSDLPDPFAYLIGPATLLPEPSATAMAVISLVSLSLFALRRRS